MMKNSDAPPAAWDGVIVAHPGTQHSYETALAAQEAGLLRNYLTGLYDKRDSRGLRVLSLIGPVRKGLAGRCHEKLRPELVRHYPAGELGYLAAVRGPLARRANQIVRWRNRRFDQIVAREIERQRPAAIVCYDTCALEAFRAARRLGIRCVLDQSLGHRNTMVQLMREEAERHPDFADTLPTDLPEWFLHECHEEAVLADFILAGSDYVRETMVAHRVEASRIVTIPYGADPACFKPVERIEDGKLRVLFVGHLSQRKGIKYLLEAVKRLALPQLELTLVGGIIGSGKGLGRYRDWFRHIPAVSHRQVHEYFQQADLFVYPSLHEGSAIAIYEALACGLPVITTRNSGSVIRDGNEGFLVPTREVEALMEKLLLLYQRPELRREMARNAYWRGCQFTWSGYRKRVSDLLQGIIAQASHSSEAVPATAGVASS